MEWLRGYKRWCGLETKEEFGRRGKLSDFNHNKMRNLLRGVIYEIMSDIGGEKKEMNMGVEEG